MNEGERVIEEELVENIGTSDDIRANLTGCWNPALTRFWFHRASMLKARGTWLLHNHASTKPAMGTVEDSPRWRAAFACYSRALQLVSLARWARQTLRAEADANEGSNCCPNGDWVYSKTGQEEEEKDGVKTKVFLDLDQLVGMNPIVVDGPLTTDSLIRLEFSLLLNLALCQLKIGSPDFATTNCTQALSLASEEWTNFSNVAPQLTSDEVETEKLSHNETVINALDVAKAFYRRAQCHFRRTRYEEAVADLEQASRLHHSQASSNLGALRPIQALLTQAREQLSRDQLTLAERLRKRKQLFGSSQTSPPSTAVAD